MQKRISEWLKNIKFGKDEEIKAQIDNFDLSALMKNKPNAAGEIIKVINEELKDFPLKKMPAVLDALYQTENKDKFFLFCYLLEKNYMDLPFLTNLENYTIHREKFKILLPTLIKIVGQGCSLDTCMWLILLKNVHEKELFDEKTIVTLKEKIENELGCIVNYLTKNNFEINNDKLIWELGIWCDIAGYFITEQTIKHLQEIANVKDATLSKFAVKSLLFNNEKVSEEILEKIAGDIKEADRFLRILEMIKKADKFPKKYTNQEWIAKSNMVDWLLYPTELGVMPQIIELLGVITRYENDFYVYKFTTDLERLKNKDVMIGVSGGYEKGKFASSNKSTGVTFSNFDTLGADYIKQGNEIIDMIENHWKKCANSSKP